MHNDEVIWQVLGKNFCSFKAKIVNDVFCRNPYNVTGLCNRVCCPLANGYYATVMEESGRCYLCLKTIERAHLPRSMWEKIELSSNYQEALKQIDTHMKNIYKDHQIHRCKQRLTRLRQTLIRMRQLQLTPQTRLVPVKKKTERREETREKKAQTAAKLEVSIEQELLNRLKQGVYGEIYNYDREAFEKILREKELAEEEEQEDYEQHNGVLDSETNTLFVEDEDDIELEDERDADEFAATSLERALASRTLVDDNDIEDLHDFESATLKKKTKRVTDPSASPSTPHHPATSRKRKTQSHRRTFLSEIPSAPRVEVEYEYETQRQHLEQC